MEIAADWWPQPLKAEDRIGLASIVLDRAEGTGTAVLEQTGFPISA